MTKFQTILALEVAVGLVGAVALITLTHNTITHVLAGGLLVVVAVEVITYLRLKRRGVIR